MQLSPGVRLGPYEIVAPLGAGGMGEVYSARDSRIGRDVAVKVSAGPFTERFEREARAVAALNHPNICTLHDVGPNYLVMELIDGDEPRGPLPLETALAYARQIADALDAAHEKGIVHRDLKPANIKIKSDGTVKVLDFGLAKITESGETPQQNLTHSPTMAGATVQGMILGTAAYMAPEQARGRPVDKRADIWAFGVVLYEMITGRRAFEGEDVSSILAAVIQSEPRWDGVPPQIRKLLASCLEKDPRKRLRDIGDVWKLLGDAAGSPAAAPRSRAGNIGWIAASLLAVVAAIAIWAPWRRVTLPAAQPLVRLDVDLGSNVSLIPLTIPTFSSVIISPDGTRLVYAASVSGGPQKLYTRRLDQPNATELSGTEGGTNPFFSRDGQSVNFWTGTGIAKVAVDGGGAVRLGDLTTMTGGTTDDQGNIVVGVGAPSTFGVVRIPPTGGAPATLVELAAGELFHVGPSFLPGGTSLFVNVVGTTPAQDTSTIDVVSIADGRRKTVARGGGSPRYVASGHLIYTKQATMFAVPFDLDRLEARGTAVAMLDDLAYDTVAIQAQFDISTTGTLVYRRNAAGAARTVQWFDAAGKQETLPARPGNYLGTPHVSPDGHRVAFVIQDGSNQDIWVYDTQRDVMTRLTFGGASFANPVWSRDGQYVLYGSPGKGVLASRADGSGQPQTVLASGRSFLLPTSLSSDGKRLAYFRPDGLPQIFTVAIEVDGSGVKAGTPERFLETQYSDLDATFSPDGRWIAYASTESGRLEVYVRTFSAGSPGGGSKWQISNGGGASPVWTANGRELLYRAGDRIMAVGYTLAGDSFVAGKPRVWAENVRGDGGFDLTPDGRRAVVIAPPVTRDGPSRDHTVVFLQNFFDELRRRAPIGQ